MKAKFGTCGKDDTKVMVVDGKGKPFKLVIGDTAVSLVDDAGDKIEVSRNALYQQYKVWTPPKQDFNSGICSWVCVCERVIAASVSQREARIASLVRSTCF